MLKFGDFYTVLATAKYEHTKANISGNEELYSLEQQQHADNMEPMGLFQPHRADNCQLDRSKI